MSDAARGLRMVRIEVLVHDDMSLEDVLGHMQAVAREWYEEHVPEPDDDDEEEGTGPSLDQWNDNLDHIDNTVSVEELR